MKNYLLVKIVGAEPMNNHEFEKTKYDHLSMPLPEKVPIRDGYKVVEQNGHTYWLQKEAFEKAAYTNELSGTINF